MQLNRRDLIRSAIALPLMLASGAGFAKKSAPPNVDWGEWFRGWWTHDFGMLGYYADDNAVLLKSKAPVDIVFMGDSITEGWFDKRPSFFKRGRVGRGIGGQTTSQMVLRMMSDVVALRPRAIHILGGANDIAGNTGPMTAQMTEDNIRAMADIAQRHGIKVIIASVLPAAKFPWAPQIDSVNKIAKLNRGLKRLAARIGATFVDYNPVLNDGHGGMKPGLAYDGVHPNEAGYDAMATVIEPVLKRVLTRR